MTAVPHDLASDELLAVAAAIDLWEKLCETLGKAGMRPADGLKLINDAFDPPAIGTVNYGPDGAVVFQPALNGKP
ncbi:hypothetical protein [Mycolicibacter kumamotonensis]|uniref:Uncharacterized protein n=1 Tax=Mycolicibacter kumamotonensis TaxID=354243 RepID=A0A1B8SL04_9MYCO|nr:hypothetical protein [Mycolicibacter kumamotonensis]OBY33446.1 hypothetical protein ACT18_00395 [Mycolicibacter kumamotonensis]